MSPLIVILTVFHQISPLKGISHSGTEFVMGFPDFRSWVSSTDRIQLVLFTDHSSSVQVTVSASGGSHSYSLQYSLSPTTQEIVTIDRELRVEGSLKSQEGILVQASQPITVYGLSRGDYSAASFLVLPVDALGTVYYVVTWEDDDASIEFLVVGVEDNTNVDITFPTSVTLLGSFAGSGISFTETVQRFDTLQIQSSDDLSGTRIDADKKIALISGNERAIIGSSGYWDHALEMLPSVDRWGKHFFVVSTPQRSQSDHLKFVSAYDNTVITINSDSPTTVTLSRAGDYHKETLQSGSSCEVTSNHPVLLVLFTRNQVSGSDTSDPTMVLIPPLEQWANSYTFSVADDSMFQNYLIIIISDTYKSGLLLDGAAVNTNSYNRIQSTDYYTGYQSISEGVYRLSHTSGDATYCAFLYGKKSYIAYYIPVGFNQNNLDQAPTTTPIITTELTSVHSSAETTVLEETTTLYVSTGEITSQEKTTEESTSPYKTSEGSTQLVDVTTKGTYSTESQTSTERDITNAFTASTDVTTQYSTILSSSSYLTNDSCWCCLNYSISSQDLATKLEELKRILTVPKKTTVLYKRGLISVMDNRPAVVVTGSALGAFILLLLAAFVILTDLSNFITKRRDET